MPRGTWCATPRSGGADADCRTDEKKWRAFPTSFLGKNGKSTGAKHVVTVGYDATSKQTFALAGHYGETQVLFGPSLSVNVKT